MTPPRPHAPATPAPRVRNAYIDTFRGVAIFGVVMIHFGGSFADPGNAWTPSFYVGLVFGQLFNFAVPLFIFLSGLLVGASSKTGSLWDYYRGRLIRIVLPYLAASLVSFFVLNHYPEWAALPTAAAKIGWLAQRLAYYGVEPTLYFIPLILQLYLLQPALKALPRWLHALAQRVAGPALRYEPVVLGLTLVFLALHVTLGILCFRSTLSYYTWCRPCGLFWLVYFFSGLHFKALAVFFNRRRWLLWGGLAVVLAAGAMISDFHYLTDRSQVGASFEFNNTGFAYCRPQLLLYDLAMVAALATGLGLGWTWRANVASFLGQYTLEIYLWHILLLYEGAWQHAEVLESCRQMPEVILIIAATAGLLIAGAKHCSTRAAGLVRQYRLVLVRDPW